MFLNGAAITAYEGETVAAVIIACSGLQTRRTVSGAPRGYYCGMGVCFDCLVVVDGVPNTRACMAPAVEGMRVEYLDGGPSVTA